MLFEIEIDRYGKYGALSDEQIRTLQSCSVSEVRTERDSDGSIRLEWGCFPIVHAETVRHFPGAKVRRVIDNESTKRLTEFGQRSTTVVNERCNVAVAGLGLLLVEEVEVHEDMCTHGLQQKLNEGWRIVAVCVQPDQRRPDYILGRTRHA